MNEQHIEVISKLFDESCVELLHEFDCDIRPREPLLIPLENAPLASIDAGSEDLEVIVILHLPMEILCLTYPSKHDITEIDEATLEDWISELSNQIVGKLKNRLLTYGCTLKIGFPRAFFGTSFDELIPEGYQQVNYCYEVDGEAFECSVLVDSINDDLVLELQENEDDGFDGGELELF